MGVCCARTESINEEVLNSFHKSDNDLDILKVPELLYESKKYEKKMLNSSINDLISNLTQAFGNITKKRTFIELFNRSLKFQDNYTNSNYLVYDLREHEDQTDNFVKKMKHINYSYDELKVLSQDKISNFRRFINNKTIIFIFPDYNSSNKVNNNKIQIENNNNNSNRNNNNGNIEQKIIMYSELITMLIELKARINIFLFASCLKYNKLSPHMIKIYDFLEERKYEQLPFILFSYNHLSTLRKEGFVFFSLHNNPNNNNNFEYSSTFFTEYSKTKIKELTENNNNNINENPFKDNINYSFWNKFNVTTMIHMTNNKEVEMKAFVPNETSFLFSGEIKEYWLSSDIQILINKKEIIEDMCIWLRNEMQKGNSFEIHITNKDIINKDNYWFYIVILIFWKITQIAPKEIMKYFEYKCIFIDGIKDKIKRNLFGIDNFLKQFGLESDIPI